LQKSAHGAGVYINFGLAFLTGRRRRYPRDYKCAVYGRNPALSADEFAQFQEFLDDVAALLKRPFECDQVTRAVRKQLATLLAWSDQQVLVRRVMAGKPLDMIIDRPALGLPP
jgi:hypothetical protein